MKTLKKLIGVIVGTIIMGIGIASFEVSNLGFDGLSCFVVSIQNLINSSYSLPYILINFIFFIMMFFFLKDRIGIGTIINFVFTGICSDLFIYLFKVIGIINSKYLLINILLGVFGVIFLALGIAVYANANLGVTPYDAVPLMISKYFKINNKPLKYHVSRKIVDGTCVLIGLIIGVLILKKSHIIGINTITSFIFVGILVTLFSKLVNKYIYKTNDETFN